MLVLSIVNVVKTDKGEKTVVKCDLKYCILISAKRFRDINKRVY
jgi:hypothetical protein